MSAPRFEPASNVISFGYGELEEPSDLDFKCWYLHEKKGIKQCEVAEFLQPGHPDRVINQSFVSKACKKACLWMEATGGTREGGPIMSIPRFGPDSRVISRMRAWFVRSVAVQGVHSYGTAQSGASEIDLIERRSLGRHQGWRPRWWEEREQPLRIRPAIGGIPDRSREGRVFRLADIQPKAWIEKTEWAADLVDALYWSKPEPDYRWPFPVLLGGCNPWNGDQAKGRPCPVCRGSTLKPIEYCLCCDRSGEDDPVSRPREAATATHPEASAEEKSPRPRPRKPQRPSRRRRRRKKRARARAR